MTENLAGKMEQESSSVLGPSTPKNQLIDLFIGPKLRFMKCNATFVFSAQAERLQSIVVYVANVADANKSGDVLPRFPVPTHNGILRYIVTSVIYAGADPRHIQVRVNSKDEVTANEIAVLFCPLQKIQFIRARQDGFKGEGRPTGQQLLPKIIGILSGSQIAYALLTDNIVRVDIGSFYPLACSKCRFPGTVRPANTTISGCLFDISSFSVGVFQIRLFTLHIVSGDRVSILLGVCDRTRYGMTKTGCLRQVPLCEAAPAHGAGAVIFAPTCANHYTA